MHPPAGLSRLHGGGEAACRGRSREQAVAGGAAAQHAGEAAVRAGGEGLQYAGDGRRQRDGGNLQIVAAGGERSSQSFDRGGTVVQPRCRAERAGAAGEDRPVGTLTPGLISTREAFGSGGQESRISPVPPM